MSNKEQTIQRLKEEYSKADSDITEEELEVALGLVAEASLEDDGKGIDHLFSGVSAGQFAVGALAAIVWPVVFGSIVCLDLMDVIEVDESKHEQGFGGLFIWLMGLFIAILIAMPIWIITTG